MLKIFMSYASEDRELVRPYFGRFKAMGLDPWMDIEKLLPGQRWEGAIEKAFREAHVIVLFMSPRSVDKRGFVQREANEAVQNLRLYKPDDIYVMPLMLEKCEVPHQIASILQYVDLSTPGAWEVIEKSIAIAAEQRKISLTVGDEHGPFRIFTDSLKERAKGTPGYDIDIAFPRVVCEKSPNSASQLSAIFAGRAASIAATVRTATWDQDPSLFPADTDGDDGFSVNSDGRWESFNVVNSNEGFFSLTCNVSWYGARAAHPNHHFETFNYLIQNDSLRLLRLYDFFDTYLKALDEISSICRQQLEREFWRRTGATPDEEARKWIADGCSPNEPEHFAAFAARADGFTFLFPPYQVGPYALGSWTVEVAYYDLLQHLRPSGPHTWAMGAPQ
ncbi:TIR domain-containing protein [Variovorax atrisoli]|uniref:TIR domain-containing protein n=1 Tax=Variovorax atrisoli TaxID=3394203 RepID=UPI00162030B7|nr:TIR domain-containing protein [Variovorax sp. BK613]MBB3638927.1 hypothetical protein [Variovorax sp. BK613]